MTEAEYLFLPCPARPWLLNTELPPARILQVRLQTGAESSPVAAGLETSLQEQAKPAAGHQMGGAWRSSLSHICLDLRDREVK